MVRLVSGKCVSGKCVSGHVLLLFFVLLVFFGDLGKVLVIVVYD
jgi:hypothetical protein